MRTLSIEEADLQGLALRAWWSWVEGGDEELAVALEEISKATGKNLEELTSALVEAETSETWLAFLGVGRLEKMPDGSLVLILFDGSEMLFGRRER